MNSNVKIIKHKVGLLHLAEELHNISHACRLMGVSRETFYTYKEAYEEGGVEALFDKSRRKLNLKNRVASPIEEAVIDYAICFPAHGQHRASNELRKQGLVVSGTGIRCIWLRHNLENFNKRLAALEKKVAEEGILLSEAQISALEAKKEDDLVYGEIETAHPGYLGAQDTFYVGTLKGVGRIYQQTFIDCYTKVALVKLYTEKTAITAADHLNDRVLPFYEAQDLPLLRILTDRGTEYCGSLQEHPYELYLALNEIEHTKTKVRSPQTNGICERFHKTILQEFYQVAFRKKIYHNLEEIQRDVDDWMRFYNEERTHQGKMCCGRTPIQTLFEDRYKWTEKCLASA